MVWQYVALIVVSALIQIALAPRPKAQKPAGLGDFTVPTAESGREMPVLFGTKILRGPNCVYYQGLTTKPIKKKP